MQALPSAAPENELGLNDLGPLAWVLEEIRKSLDGATRAMRRFVRDAELARGSELAELDASHLRIARQQLHQAVGALEMVGLGAPAKLLQAMEALAQKFVQRPEFCSDDAANKVERASFALTEYLEGVLKGKTASSVALFSQYRDVMALVGSDRVHPGDLWPVEWRWIDVELSTLAKPLVYSPAVRARVDQGVLQTVKSSDQFAAESMRDICLGLALTQGNLEPRVFWKVSAAFFEAIAFGLCPADVYVKRAASRILMQYASLSRGEEAVSERLALDLLFFCAQAIPPSEAHAPSLAAVRAAYGLARTKPFNYDTPQFGRFDPALLVQARKRIASATETWSALAGGDTNRLKGVGEQFASVTDAIVKLHPESTELAGALTLAVDTTVKSGEAPSASLAMEVATAILYLEAAYEDLDPTDSHMAVRSERLAQRLRHVCGGGSPEAMEAWMEELYRRVSDRQTMGSVVDELRLNLSTVEKSLDEFFRSPAEKRPLHEVPSQLAQMRGVFSVLGLDQASLAALRMRDTVEKLLVDTVETVTRNTIFERLGNSLGAMGFLIDMLSYQRALAKKLFVYDEDLGEFKPLMGREKAEPAKIAAVVDAREPPASLPSFVDTAVQTQPVLIHPHLATVAMVLPAALEKTATNESEALGFALPLGTTVSTTAQDDEDDAELRDIFLDEAREVVQNGLAAAMQLVEDPGNLGHQTTLRRAFHTLKGSSRMVGLTELGEAGWAMEQLLNTWLAEQRPAGPELIALSNQAMNGFGRWVEDIASHNDANWSAQPFRDAADALRLHGRSKLLVLPRTGSADPGLVDSKVSDSAETLPPDFADSMPEQESAVSAGASEHHPAGAADSVFPDFEATQTLDSNTTVKTSPGTGQPNSGLPAASENLLDGLDFGTTSGVAAQDTHPSLPLATEPALTVDAPPPLMAPLHDLNTVTDQSAAVLPHDAPASYGFEPHSPSQPAHAAPLGYPSTGNSVPVLPVPETATAPVDESEQVKVIGTLKIGIPLYNVYLNEADEWSRTLLTELTEWSLELHHNIADTSVALAHSLSGSSATVGFVALSEMARALEQSLEHVQLHGQGTAEHAKTFIDAAEDIRRLLHQFAAGFLKEPDRAILLALKGILETEFHTTRGLQLEDWDRPDFESTSLQGVEAPVLETQSEQFVAAQRIAEPLPVEPEPQRALQVFAATDVVDEPFAPRVKAQEHVVPFDAVSEPVATNPVAVPMHSSMVTNADGFAPALQRRAHDRAALVASSVDDDIDVQDVLDVDLFPIFEEEAAELFPKLGGALRPWVAEPENMGARNEVLRVLHTLKGSARLAGALRMGEMTHRMESAIESLGRENLQSVQLEPLLNRFDDLQATFDQLRQTPAQNDVALAKSENMDAPTTVIPAPISPTETAAAPDTATAHIAQTASPGVVLGDRRHHGRAETATKLAAMPSAVKINPNQSVRVRSQLLDRLVNQAGEVMITRARLDAHLGQLRGSLGELSGNLDRLRQQLRDVEVQAESQMQSRLAQSKESAQGFDPLEFDRFTRVQELTRMMAESVNDVATVQRNLQRTIEGTEDDLIAQARQARELQRDLLRTRMVEFEGISERLYAVVRQSSKEAGKQIKLDITGGAIDMDRGVLDRMTPAFEHLLRNAVAHGIEEPSVRERAGKSATGTIAIGLQQSGNDISVDFSDDGAGLNLDRIRQKAVASGLVGADVVLTDAEAANLIFTPGFSTATAITELSGRGIGMDVVRAEVNALGGRIETTSELGRGSHFKLILPLTTAVTQVVMVRMGELTIGVPANLVEIVRRAPKAELEQAYQTDTFNFAGEAVPFYWSGALLQASGHSSEPVSKTLPVVIFRSAGQRLAVHVDEILGNQEVVVKNLGPQLARLPGLAGMSVLASGAVVLIYNPVALATVYGDQARLLRAKVVQANAANLAAHAISGGTGQPPSALGAGMTQIPLVLVVDDSITVRRVTQRLLKREGFRVALASDGLHALEQLAIEKPAVILSDIEMPRMDGFDLARNIRGDVNLRDVPIIMITSRIAEKHREHARELGVNHYLGKPYSEDELVGLVRHYCASSIEV